MARGEPYLRVSNLHPDLTERDLKDLFGRIGPVKFVKLRFNTQGQSTGIAFVGYRRPRDCSYAIEEFDGRRAAGQIISVENAVPLAERIFSSAKGRSKKHNKARKAKKQPKTAEELDAELSQYMATEGGQDVPAQEDQNMDAEVTEPQQPQASGDVPVDNAAPALNGPAVTNEQKQPVAQANQPAGQSNQSADQANQPAGQTTEPQDQPFPAVSNGEVGN